MPLIEGLELVWYRAEEWDTTRAFYGEILGLPVAAEDADRRWVEFAPGGPVRLALSAKGPDDLHGGALPVFRVSNLADALATLDMQGITCYEPEPAPNGGMRADVFDPTGNRLQLWEAPAPTAAPAVGGTDLVTGIDLVWYITVYPEWEQARTFFADTLGLTQTAAGVDPHWAFFATGTPTRLGLFTPEAEQHGPAGACAVLLEVRDMDAVLHRLRGHRIEHSETAGDPGGRLVNLTDPAGNDLQLHWTRT